MSTFEIFRAEEDHQHLEEGLLRNTLATLGIAGSLLASPVRSEPTTTAKTDVVNNEIQQGFNLAFYFIKSQENSKFNRHGGWNNAEQKWMPHTSVEGGLDTIAYGHKFASKAQAKQYAAGITDDQANKLLYADLVEKYQNIQKKLKMQGQRVPENKYAIAMLLDIEFNTNKGIAGYPKFVKALMNNDTDTMSKNYHRYAMIKGAPVELGRSKAFKQALLDPFVKTHRG